MGRIPEAQRGTHARRPRTRPAARIGRVLLCAAAAVPLTAAATGVRAGVVLISRQSWVQATGSAPGAGPDNFNLTGGTRGFDSFSNYLTSSADATAPALVDAHQYSVPATGTGWLQGAYAEGTVQAELNAPQSSAVGRTNFDMTFKVVGSPAWYDFGGAFGTDGGGTASAALLPVGLPGNPRPVFSSAVQGGPDNPDGSQMLSRQGLLSPGTYALKISAEAPGTLNSSSAYYTINLTLDGVAARHGFGGLGDPGAGTSSGPAAAPMPAAVWPGLIMLAGLAALVRAPRRSGVRWVWK